MVNAVEGAAVMTSNRTKIFTQIITCEPCRFVSQRETEYYATRHCYVHHIRAVECGTLGECRRAVGSWRVAQDVEEQRLSLNQQILRLAEGVHVEHVATQRLCRVVTTILLSAEGNSLQGVLGS